MSSTIAASTASSSSSSTSSPRCVPFAFRRGGARGRLPAPAPAGARTPAVARGGGAPAAAAGGCGRPLCRAAEVLGGGIQSAFFASLDSCSCVEVRTKSFKESEATTPLMQMLSSPPSPDDDCSSTAAVRNFGRRKASSFGGKPRRGLGCCTPKSTSVD